MTKMAAGSGLRGITKIGLSTFAIRNALHYSVGAGKYQFLIRLCMKRERSVMLKYCKYKGCLTKADAELRDYKNKNSWYG